MRTMIVIFLGILALGMFAPPGTIVAQNTAGDVCPEPNNEFQRACVLRAGEDAAGFISSSDDVDAYRLEVLDFSANIQIELVDPSSLYRFVVGDWNGKEISRSEQVDVRQIANFSVPLPGTYYIFVQSPSGITNLNDPYRLSSYVLYRSGTPDIIMSNDYRDDKKWEPLAGDGLTYGDNGAVTMTLQRGNVQSYRLYDPNLQGNVFVSQQNFVLTFDTTNVQISSQKYAGYHVTFRSDSGASPAYAFMVDTVDGNFRLERYTPGDFKELIPWRKSPSIDNNPGSINRTVIRCDERDIIININGQEIVHLQDAVFQNPGQFTFGVMAFGDGGHTPVTVRFDNILLTTPVR